MTSFEVLITVAIFAMLVVIFSSLAQVITVGGRNVPASSGSIPAQQQVLDQINAFLLQFSRDVRGASAVHVTADGKTISLGSVTYRLQNGEIIRNEKTVLRGIGSAVFQENDGAITVTLAIRYRPQTGGKKPFEEKEFSFVVQRRVAPSPSP